MRVTLPKKDAQNSVTPPATAPRSSNPLLSTFEALQAALQQNSAKAPVKAQSEPKEETPKAPMGKAELMEAAREAAREPAAGQAVLPSEPRLMRLEAPAVEVKTAAAAEAARQALEAQRRREEVVAKRRREEALAQRRRELPEEARLVRDRIKIPPLDLPWGEALAHQGLGASDRLPGGAWRIVPRDDSMTPYRRPGRKALLQDMQQRLARHGTLTVVENAAMILGHHHVSRRQLDRMILKSSEKSASAGNSDIP
ncbi:hypothetical protein T484DRAFT_1797309 [Baffinella frigidus]|nr:hypothetical protein T484DRAFT_1797309 [Cryptophyta sp. CCMP2293]